MWPGLLIPKHWKRSDSMNLITINVWNGGRLKLVLQTNSKRKQFSQMGERFKLDGADGLTMYCHHRWKERRIRLLRLMGGMGLIVWLLILIIKLHSFLFSIAYESRKSTMTFSSNRKILSWPHMLRTITVVYISATNHNSIQRLTLLIVCRLTVYA